MQSQMLRFDKYFHDSEPNEQRHLAVFKQFSYEVIGWLLELVGMSHLLEENVVYDNPILGQAINSGSNGDKILRQHPCGNSRR